MTIEVVTMHTYRIYCKRPSALGLGQEIETQEGFTCPKCQSVNPEIEHGEAGQCPNCGLHFRLYGNGLYCSDKFIEPHLPGKDVAALYAKINKKNTGFMQRVFDWLGLE